MHRQWVCILLVVGLMIVCGLGAAISAISNPAPDPEAVMIALTGGILFGAAAGVVIVFSRTQTHVAPKRRPTVFVPRPSPALAKVPATDTEFAPAPAAPESPDRQTATS
jgi:hypothetical protein